MERVTYMEQGVVSLDNFNMTIWEGEIFGLVPVNHYGLGELLERYDTRTALDIYHSGHDTGDTVYPGVVMGYAEGWRR